MGHDEMSGNDAPKAPGRRETRVRRMVYQDILRSRAVCELPHALRWAWLSIILHADDEGRFKADPLLVRSEAFPRDADPPSAEEVARFLERIEECDMVRRYEHRGETYGVILNWETYQHLDEKKRRKSYFPPPPEDDPPRGKKKRKGGSALLTTGGRRERQPSTLRGGTPPAAASGGPGNGARGTKRADASGSPTFARLSAPNSAYSPLIPTVSRNSGEQARIAETKRGTRTGKEEDRKEERGKEEKITPARAPRAGETEIDMRKPPGRNAPPGRVTRKRPRWTTARAFVTRLRAGGELDAQSERAWQVILEETRTWRKVQEATLQLLEAKVNASPERALAIVLDVKAAKPRSHWGAVKTVLARGWSPSDGRTDEAKKALWSGHSTRGSRGRVSLVREALSDVLVRAKARKEATG